MSKKEDFQNLCMTTLASMLVAGAEAIKEELEVKKQEDLDQKEILEIEREINKIKRKKYLEDLKAELNDLKK